MKSDKDILKTVFAWVGGFIFLAVSATLAISAHHYQIINQPMPNGKGQFMSYQEGYLIAVVCFLISAVFFIVARKYSRAKS